MFISGTVSGGDGDDIIQARGDSDRIFGGAGFDTIISGGGEDLIDPGTGGGSVDMLDQAEDRLVFGPGYGQLRVTGFIGELQDGVRDKLDVRSFDFSDFDDFLSHVSANGNEVHVSVGADTLIFRTGFSVPFFTPTDFSPDFVLL